MDEAAHRTLFEAVYTIISIYILAMMLVLLKAPIGKKKMENQIHQKANEAEVYFKLFQNQVAGPSHQTPKGKVLILRAD
uniref:Uncharacterized protein n=1 Tax=Acrobeloides nanus TaxID=290746 RepID=A0A914CVM2_9BILA